MVIFVHVNSAKKIVLLLH
jgi:hypothetical protein